MFLKDGTLSFEDIAQLDVEEKQFKTRQLIYGDIILEKSGLSQKAIVFVIVIQLIMFIFRKNCLI